MELPVAFVVYSWKKQYCSYLLKCGRIQGTLINNGTYMQKSVYCDGGTFMRIIAGSARGTKLKTPPGSTTRPTADRVKESLFNIIGSKVIDADVLDIFAGTGALGLEALSRGASSAIFIDKATKKLIADNAVHTHPDGRTEIMGGDAVHMLSMLKRNGRKFDIVFCDPPYRKGLWQRAFDALSDGVLLNDDALVVIECGGDEKLPAETGHLTLSRTKDYGTTTKIYFFRYNVPSKGGGLQ